MKNELKKIQFRNAKIIAVTGNSFDFTLEIEDENKTKYQITFVDYDIDNTYPLPHRTICELYNLIYNQRRKQIELIIWLEDDKLLEKVTITAKEIKIN